MDAIQTVNVQCPYCWQNIELVVDCSVHQQEYIEDCEVCCRPIVVSIQVIDNEPMVQVRMEDE